MADSAEFDVIMNGVDNGVTDMTDDAANALENYNSELADLARKEAANERAKQLKADFEQLTDAQKEAIVAADDQRLALEGLATAEQDVTNSQTATASATDNVKATFTEFNAALQVGQQALRYLSDAYDATIEKSSEYAQQVKDLQSVSGESAENTSRFIQILDDYKISAEDAMTATRALTKQGYAPTTDTLADLSEKYLALNSVQERNDFVIKNLGKSGLEWINVLKQGPDAIRAQSAAVNDALVLNEKSIAQAEQARLAQDQWNDTLQGLQVTVGNKLTPTFTTWLTVIDKVVNDTDGARNVLWSFVSPLTALTSVTQLYGDTYNELAANAQNAANSQKDVKNSLEPTTEEIQAAKDAAAALSAEYTNILSVTRNIESAYDGFKSSLSDLRQQQADLRSDIANTPAWETDKIAEYQAKLDEIPAKLDDVAAQYHEAMSKIAYDNLMSKLSVDGLTDAEFEQAQQAGVALGIFTKASADQAIALNNLTTELANGQISVDQFNQAVKDGSFKVDEANKAIAQSEDDKGKAIAKNTDEPTEKVKQLAAATDEASKTTVKSNDDAITSWGRWADAVSGDIDTVIGKLNELIEAIAAVPPIPTGTSGTNEIGNGQESGTLSGGIVRHAIDVFVNGDYQKTVTIH